MRQATVFHDKELDVYLVVGTRRPSNRIYATAEEAQRAANRSNNARMTRAIGKSYTEVLKNKKLSYDDLYHKGYSYTTTDGSSVTATVVSATDIESGDSDKFKNNDAEDSMDMGTAFVALYHETWDNHGERSLYDIAKNKALLKRVALVMWNDFTSEEKKALEAILRAVN